MEKRKLANWLKKRKKPDTKDSSIYDEKQQSEMEQTREEHIEKFKEEPIKEYNETLYSKEPAQKQPMKTTPEKKPLIKRTSWESADLIEENIDRMRRKQTQSTDQCNQTREDTDKKVDFILLKKKR